MNYVELIEDRGGTKYAILTSLQDKGKIEIATVDNGLSIVFVEDDKQRDFLLENNDLGEVVRKWVGI